MISYSSAFVKYPVNSELVIRKSNGVVAEYVYNTGEPATSKATEPYTYALAPAVLILAVSSV